MACGGGCEYWLPAPPLNPTNPAFAISVNTTELDNSPIPVVCEELTEEESKAKSWEILLDENRFHHDVTDYDIFVTISTQWIGKECVISEVWTSIDNGHHESYGFTILNNVDWHIPGSKTIYYKVSETEDSILFRNQIVCPPDLANPFDWSSEDPDDFYGSVTVVVDDFVPCGTCQPDKANWVCSSWENPFWTGEVCDFNVNSNTYLISFEHNHRYNFTRDGISQGVGRIAFHSLNITHTHILLGFYGATPDDFDVLIGVSVPGMPGGNSPIGGLYEVYSPIICSTASCLGAQRSDHLSFKYNFYPADFWVPSNSEIVTYFQDEGGIHNNMVHLAQMSWDNHKVFVDRSISDPTSYPGIEVAGPFNSSVILAQEFFIMERHSGFLIYRIGCLVFDLYGWITEHDIV